MPPSKRIKSSKNKSLSSIELNPVISLTSDHRISVLGHQSSRKILRASTGGKQGTGAGGNEDSTILKEVSQWIYTSRPGDATSFFSKKTQDHPRRVGAVVDPSSRTVFVLQNDNHVMKIWGLDDDVNGPDDELGSRTDKTNVNNDSSSLSGVVKKVQFDSPVLCMDSIPIKRQVRVNIKGGKGSKSNNSNQINGGITGLLANGQMFVVLVCIANNKRTIRVGIYGKSTEAKGRRRSTRLTNQKPSTDNGDAGYIHSVVGFTAHTKGSTSVDLGQKRKLDYVENDDDSHEWGEVTLTYLSQNVKKSDSISFCKHSVVISSLVDDVEQNGNNSDGNSSSYQRVDGNYSKKAGDVKLPHTIYQPKLNGNGSSYKHKHVHVTQLDLTHISLVYQDTSNVWYTTILDTRYGECVIKPFSLSKRTSTTVVEIGGLGTSILAVLTSDDVLAVYDVRRAVKLHEMDVRKVMGKDENGTKCQFGISTHWFTGAIGITCNAMTKSSNGTKNTVSMSCARIGVYDTDRQVETSGTNKKPFIKGAYNLARIIASSIATADKKTFNSHLQVQPITLDMTNWFSSTTKNNLVQPHEYKLADIIVELEEYRTSNSQTNGSKSKSFFEKFKEVKEKLQKTQQSSVPAGKKKLKLENGNTSKAVNSASEATTKSSVFIPQSLIDVSVSIAMNIILTPSSKGSDITNATNVLLQCIETGMVSGRNHFDKAIISTRKKNGETLRSLLLALQAQNTTNEEEYLPLSLISNLLQHCKDGLTEHMLVSMVHFIMCHPTNKQFVKHWEKASTDSGWYADSGVKVLEKRLRKALHQHKNAKSIKSKNCEDLQNLVQSLENRLAVYQQIFFINKIVTQSKCNPALLRTAIQNGLTQTNAGEVEVLMQVLSKILRRTGKDKITKKTTFRSGNTSTCVSQWLSAVIDTNLGLLLTESDSNAMEQVKKEVSASISQTQAIMSLKELLSHVDEMIDCKKNKVGTMEVTSVPLYGIEPLLF